MSTKTTAYDSQASSRLARFAATGLTALAILGAMGAGIAFLQHRANAQPMPERNPPVTVATEPVSIVDAYEVEERFTGRLEPARRTRIAFERSGLVTAVLHDEGEFVTTGTLLARLDTAELETGRRLLQAQRRELAAQLGLAEAELVRNKALETKGWASRQRYDESRYRVARLRAGIERVNAQLEANRIDLDKSVVRAPFSGTITARRVDEGAVTAAGASIVELFEDASPRVRIGVSVEVADALEIGAHYPLRANGTALNGRLAALRPDLQTGTQTVTAIFDLGDAQPVPFGGLVELISSRRVEATGAWLPLAALSEGRKGLWSVLTVVDGWDGPVVAREAVEVIHVAGDAVFVRGTFKQESIVVVSGSNRIVPGQRVFIADRS